MLTLKRRSFLNGSVCVAALSMSNTQPAQADEPVTVALITGGALVAATAITAVAAVAVATITAISVVASSESSTDSGDSGGENAEGQSLSLDEGDSDSKTMEIPSDMGSGPFILDHGGALQLINKKTEGAGFAIKYNFHGDIKAAPKSVKSYVHAQTFDFKMKVRIGKKGERQVVPIMIRDTSLSTTDIPGTDGYNRLEIEARSGGEKFSWKAGVRQGRRGVHDRVPGDQRILTEKGVIKFPGGVVIFIPVDFENQKVASVDLRITFTGSGSLK